MFRRLQKRSLTLKAPEITTNWFFRKDLQKLTLFGNRYDLYFTFKFSFAVFIYRLNRNYFYYAKNFAGRVQKKDRENST